MNKLAFSAFCTIAFSSAALADLHVEFIEGAPKDRFVITNASDCALGAGQFEINFENSNAGLIFDVTGSGAGVEVFQPFEVTEGAEYLSSEPSISDGDQRAVLNLSGLGAQETIAFTIDVDDTNGSREITVSDGEFTGTSVSFSADGATYSEVMDRQAQVSLATPACVA